MAKKRTTRSTLPSAKGKQLVIVESPSKARTINKYLGKDFVVVASVGHIRDLPTRNPKGDKSPIPGVDVEHGFEPQYEVLRGKGKLVTELKKAARNAKEVWFATDLDREGEAIAWHLAELVGISPEEAQRVIFSAITKDEIEHAFSHPHPIDMDRVNAQQARRILDRIVGYGVSPLLWKKVARGLSAGRVQTVAVRLVVEREREIRSFVPDENWQVLANFHPDGNLREALARQWSEVLSRRDAKGKPPTQKQLNAWLSEQGAVRAELVEVGGRKFELELPGMRDGKSLDDEYRDPTAHDNTPKLLEIVRLAGLTEIDTKVEEDPRGKGPARWRRRITGQPSPEARYRVRSIETRRTSTRPPAPFITSTLQQAASSRLAFSARRTMQAAQQLYEGVDLPGEGPTGLITYMRTDSTHLSGAALGMARDYIENRFGRDYLPDKPNFFASSNKQAQEAHEAIRPTSLRFPPDQIKSSLRPDQYRLYSLIWNRFVACQMKPAQWDSTSIFIEGGIDPSRPVTFKTQGRVLVFDGFYKVAGVPAAGDEQLLPALSEDQELWPFSIEPRQRFSSPPPRYTEASLIKKLEAEGIGRPSTYASIIQVIQDRKYVEQIERRFYATSLGEVVVDMLREAFPGIFRVDYTKEMEEELDKIEQEHLDWVTMLENFYGPFSRKLEDALEKLKHAKAVTQPAPDEYRCGECGASTVYRFGKNGRFLSCSRYPKCRWASPIDRDGRPRPVEETNVACPKCGEAMIKRVGRFGPFLGCRRYNDKDDPCDGILNLDKKTHKVKAPSQPPLETDMACPKCGKPLYLRNGLRGPWLGCSTFPKCKGRLAWSKLDEKAQKKWKKALEEHMREHPIPIITTVDGTPLTDANGRPLPDAPVPGEELVEA